MAIGAFATSQIVFIKELGLGAVLAVLIDATIIRALFGTLADALLGAANWWAPQPLQRLHLRVGLRVSAAWARPQAPPLAPGAPPT